MGAIVANCGAEFASVVRALHNWPSQTTVAFLACTRSHDPAFLLSILNVPTK